MPKEDMSKRGVESWGRTMELRCTIIHGLYYDPRPFCGAYETPEGRWIEYRETFVRAVLPSSPSELPSV